MTQVCVSPHTDSVARTSCSFDSPAKMTVTYEFAADRKRRGNQNNLLNEQEKSQREDNERASKRENKNDRKV